ncbi:hypothetical protein PUN28_017734 [Cardiocondyla obscurior]|uniref:Uncharacterized protein n=1 Tax=Cardiocondyla obscurior TaxID=286306 RepID=A0AAW2EL56_9HYME
MNKASIKIFQGSFKIKYPRKEYRKYIYVYIKKKKKLLLCLREYRTCCVRILLMQSFRFKMSTVSEIFYWSINSFSLCFRHVNWHKTIMFIWLFNFHILNNLFYRDSNNALCVLF